MNVLNTYNEFDSSHFDLNVDHYGAEICDKNYAFGPSVRENYVLHFIVTGKGKFTVDGETTSLQEGDIFLLPKNKLTYYQADAEDPWSYLWVGFSGSQAESILQETSLQDIYFAHSHLDSKILDQLLRLMRFSKTVLNTVTELEMIGELYHLLAALVKEFPREGGERGTDQSKYYIKQVLRIIHSQYDTPLRVEDLAKKLNLNRSYLYKLFKAQTGYAIKDYILQVKMQRSASLLRNPALSVSEIAYSVGYSDPLAFSKVFKTYYHVSPRQYRKEQGNL